MLIFTLLKSASDSTGSFNLVNVRLYFIIDNILMRFAFSFGRADCLLNFKIALEMISTISRALFAPKVNELGFETRGEKMYWQIDKISDNRMWLSCSRLGAWAQPLRLTRYLVKQTLKIPFCFKPNENSKTWRFMIISISLNCIIMRLRNKKVCIVLRNKKSATAKEEENKNYSKIIAHESAAVVES